VNFKTRFIKAEQDLIAMDAQEGTAMAQRDEVKSSNSVACMQQAIDSDGRRVITQSKLLFTASCSR
jgi:hypothetical protein